MTPHRRRDEGGFTLIELMVVLLIMAILMGIAIPTYLGARNRAANRAAQASLVNALATAQGSFANHQNYAGLGPSAMKVLEPALQFGSTSTGPNDVGMAVGTGSPPMSVSMTDLATTGTCYYVVDAEATSSAWIGKPGIPKPGTYYGASKASGGSCSPETPGSSPSSGWQTAFSAVSAP